MTASIDKQFNERDLSNFDSLSKTQKSAEIIKSIPFALKLICEEISDFYQDRRMKEISFYELTHNYH